MQPEREELAKEIEGHLYSGHDISDEMYVKLITMEIDTIQPKCSETTFLELLNTASKDKIVSESDFSEFTSTMQLTPEKEDRLREVLKVRTHAFTKGFVLLDFPTTYKQAKLLETALSGFIPTDERIIGAY